METGLIRVCLIFPLVLLLAGCGEPTKPAPKSGLPAASVAPAGTAAESQRTPPTDESLSEDEYLRLGMPSQDRDWAGSDMLTAEKVLGKLAVTNPGQLPRSGSKRSGRVFARIVSPQNLEMYRNKTLPTSARLQQGQVLLHGYNAITKTYLTAFIAGQVSDSDMIELFGGSLRGIGMFMDLIEEYLPSIRADDPQYAVRMGGLEQARRGAALVMMGGLQTVTERQSYRSSERAKLVVYLSETAPQIVPRLLDGSRRETAIRIEQMKDDPQLADLKSELNALHRVVTRLVNQ